MKRQQSQKKWLEGGGEERKKISREESNLRSLDEDPISYPVNQESLLEWNSFEIFKHRCLAV
jgi:hypothetical protein